LDESKPQEAKPLELVITLSQEGSIKVQCPMLKDTILMFGLLESAKVAIIQHNAEANKPVIQKSNAMMNFVRNRIK
jgi:hypothetical protein